jgi:AraC family transcriptional regulator of adaptative response/methylated-DNA-[protein]-cysteine methyltransferase
VRRWPPCGAGGARSRDPGRDTDLPLDVQGTAFQEAVWQALRAIPPGETRSYAQLATEAGSPRRGARGGDGMRGQPCRGADPLPPRPARDGSMGGYAYGVDRKRVLLKREGVTE